ncbi:MAG: MoxR family ATPase [Lachnospiraceae bacterium]|nr:MoxR family ATPase [Lachnospiraceae bacterium]
MADNAFELINRIKTNIKTTFAGNETIIDRLICCMLSGGHLLLEDVPGVGKTTLALSLAHSINCSFGRVSFSPDTLPSDITGLTIYNSATKTFDYRPGPIMCNIFLADEINRTPPKTQSALLEAMQEKKVTVDGATHDIEGLFMVIATQNPIEFAGTYPLPEAQLDRFMMKLSLGYPSKDDELGLAHMFLEDKKVETLTSVCNEKDVLNLQDMVRNVTVKDNVIEYVHNIITATRNEKRFMTGASPRAMLALIRASQANALMDGRDFVKPDDIKQLYVPVLLHRLPLSVEARMSHDNPETILKSLIATVEVPVDSGN